MAIVNENAPVIAMSETDIEAPQDAVWEVLTDVARWPEWNPAVKAVSVDGPLAPGTVFSWNAGPGRITSTLREVDPPRTLAWTGKTMGIHAGHVYLLEDHGGKTRVRTRESWEGLLSRFLPGLMRKTLQKSLDAAVIHSMGRIMDRTQERLCTTDVAVIRMRRKLLAAARALMEDGTPPPGADRPDLYTARSCAASLPPDLRWEDALADWHQARTLEHPTPGFMAKRSIAERVLTTAEERGR